MAYIQFKDIVKKYGENTVLKHINLEINQGELVTLLGPSGCGKSTLLRCLSGLENVSEGSIFLDGKDITDVNPKDRGIGMVFQQYSLFPNMTIEQNVAFGLKMKKENASLIREKVTDMLKIVGLEEKLKSYPSQLSGGQQQRAALARAIVTQPKVLLLDEPLSAIDALLRHSLQVEIRRIQKEMNITAVFVTHDQEEAMVMSDTIHLMYQGQIEQSATPTELYTKPATKFAANFIGHYNVIEDKEFKRISGEAVETNEIAFRPELIRLSKESKQSNESFQIKGKIKGYLPHGNILRYEIDCDGIQIDVDVLFGETVIYQAEDIVYLQITKAECIYL